MNQNRNAVGLIVSITKGILYDRSVRRQAMFRIILAAVAMLFLGATLLSGWLMDRPVVFILYWLACAWLTITAVLLALYDILRVRVEARKERDRLESELLDKDKDR